MIHLEAGLEDVAQERGELLYQVAMLMCLCSMIYVVVYAVILHK